MSAARLTAIVAAQPRLMRMLAAVDALGLPDSWLAAGAIRNLVWDELHGRAVSEPADVDVVYFDAADIDPAREAAAEARLTAAMPGPVWEVRNQARMHLKSGWPPYRNAVDGIRHFPETPTAVGVRLRGSHIEVAAPHGLDDLFDMMVRPTSDDVRTTDPYRARMAAKNWPARWPKLRVLGL
jgi:hypothetical protein